MSTNDIPRRRPAAAPRTAPRPPRAGGKGTNHSRRRARAIAFFAVALLITLLVIGATYLF